MSKIEILEYEPHTVAVAIRGVQLVNQCHDWAMATPDVCERLLAGLRALPADPGLLAQFDTPPVSTAGR